MAPNFQDFIAASSRRPVVLSELSPSIALGGWTAVGATAPNVYRTRFDKRVLGGGVRQGTLDRNPVAYWPLNKSGAQDYDAMVRRDGAVAYWPMEDNVGFVSKMMKTAPIGLWRLNEALGAGSALDIVGGRNGTPHGGLAFGQPGPFADGSTAALFNGSSGYIELPGTVPNQTSAGAVAVAIYPTARGDYFSRVTGASWEDQRLVLFQTNADDTLRIAVADGVHYSIFATTANLPLNAWTTVVFTWTAGACYVYLNGVLDRGPMALSFTPDMTGATNWIGRSTGLYISYATGRVAGVALHDRLVTPSEVATLHEALLDTETGEAVDVVGTLDAAPHGTLARRTAGLPTGGYATNFNGTTDYFDCGTPAVVSPVSPPITWEVWARKRTPTLSTFGSLVSNKSLNGAAIGGIYFALCPSSYAPHPNGPYFFTRFNTGSISFACDAPAGSVDANWHHWAVVVSAQNVIIYFDGAVAFDWAANMGPFGPADWTGQTILPLLFGSDMDGYGYKFDGDQTRPAQYHAALTPTQIAAHYAAGRRALDATGHGNDGVWIGAAYPSGALLARERGESAALDGATAEVVADPVSLPVFSIECVAERDGAQAQWVSLFSDEYVPAPGNEWVNYAVCFDASGDLIGGIHDPSTWHWTTPVPMSDAVKHHVMLTYDGAELKLYVDGGTPGTVAWVGTPQSGNASFRVGRGWNSTYPVHFHGLAGQVVIYDRALSASEVAERCAVTNGEVVPPVPGGVWRPCEGVRENATDLTERASVALVSANAGSWYWDPINQFLYVHSTTGSNPDLFTLYQAFTKLRIADAPVVVDETDGDPDTGAYYHPWLVGGLPKLSTQVEDLLFGIKRTDTGDVTFSNAHGFWNTLIARNAQWAWKNKKARFLLGGSYAGQALPLSEYADLTTMLVEDVSADERECVFTLKPLLKKLDVEVPVTPYFSSSYASLGDGVEGTKKWIGYGRATIKPDLTDTTVSYGKWTIADAAFQTLFAVNNVWAVEKSTGARTLLTPTTHYTTDLTACTLTVVGAAYPHATYDIEVDVTGKPDGAGSYLQTFGAIVKDMLKTFLDVVDADLDLAAFAQADVDAPQELSVWLKSPRALTSILATSEAGQPSLERSVMGTVQQTPAGQWTCWVWDPGYDPASVVSLRREDFAAFKPEPKLESIFATTRIYYDRNHSADKWPAEEWTDARVQYLHETTDVVEIYTFLKEASAAETLAQRYQLMAGGPTLEVEFSERGAKLAEAAAGDKVLVDYAPAPDASGAFVSKPFEVLRLDRSFSPVFAVAGRLGDLRGLAGKIGRWADAGAADWASAAAEERSVNGYWADPSGYVDPADASTLNSRIWW